MPLFLVKVQVHGQPRYFVQDTVGMRLSKKPMSRARALRQMAAVYRSMKRRGTYRSGGAYERSFPNKRRLDEFMDAFNITKRSRRFFDDWYSTRSPETGIKAVFKSPYPIKSKTEEIVETLIGAPPRPSGVGPRKRREPVIVGPVESVRRSTRERRAPERLGSGYSSCSESEYDY